MLKSLKRAVVAAGRSAGVFTLLARSHWRSSRLLILGYHGVSLEDEHQWNGALYLSPEKFRSRMEAIKRNRCTVLALEEALDLLRIGKLPPRCVVLTFDDGTYDFYKIAYPILKEYGYPATLYVATYYIMHQYPVAPGTWSYMLWKKQGSVVDASNLLGENVTFDLRTPVGRAEALARIRSFAAAQAFTAEQRDVLSMQLAQLLGFDYATFCRKRMIQLLRPEELKAVATQGVSVQLHTHHHLSGKDRETYLGEINENRGQIVGIVGHNPCHFCYPSGNYKPEYVAWLREAGIESATTCDPGIAARATDRLLLPRLIDALSLSDIEFEGWLAGFGALLPRRRLRNH
ncbi:MAG: polysaccharide deacetylase family protein [Candidatus Sulfotelmatobacter sp.]